MRQKGSIFSDFLAELEVPHTVSASDAAFEGMNFQSLFGFSRLLNSYGIDAQAYRLSDKSGVAAVPPPYIAQLNDGFVIVTEFDNDAVTYKCREKVHTKPKEEFVNSMTGVVLLAYPGENAGEPDYGKHRFFEIASAVKLWLLIICASALAVFGFVEAGLWKKEKIKEC